VVRLASFLDTSQEAVITITRSIAGIAQAKFKVKSLLILSFTIVPKSLVSKTIDVCMFSVVAVAELIIVSIIWIPKLLFTVVITL
jgi:hypothetical protein